MAIDNYHAIPPPGSHAEVSGRDLDAVHSRREYMTPESLTKWTYFFLGCSILLPWNALTNGTPFFLSRLVHSPFYPTFSSYASSVYTLTKLFFLFYCTVTAKQSSPSRRIFASNIVTTFLITSLCLSTLVRGTPLGFFSFALFNAASLAITSSYLCAAVFAQAAVLGPQFLQSVLLGQGGIATAISGVQVISAAYSVWGLSSDPTGLMKFMTIDDRDYRAEGITARIFFGVSALFVIMTLACYAWLTRQPFYQTVISIKKPRSEVEDADEHTGLVSNNHRGVSTWEGLRVYQIFKLNWDYMFSIAYTYTVTMSVFPAITVRVQSVNPTVPSVLFTAVHFFVFASSDFIGRQTCSFPRFLAWSAKKILALCLTRTLFIPLIVLCNVHRFTMNPAPPVLNSDILFMLILAFLGYTNGFISCLATIVVASPERNSRLKGQREDIDVVGALSATFLVVGLASGSLSSFGVAATL